MIHNRMGGSFLTYIILIEKHGVKDINLNNVFTEVSSSKNKSFRLIKYKENLSMYRYSKLNFNIPMRKNKEERFIKIFLKYSISNFRSVRLVKNKQ